jgi:Holliday junction resolvase
MTHYRDGRQFEYTVRNALITDGYDLVLRTAGSKTVVDLAAFKPGQALFIQAKRDGRISPAERIELLRVAAHIGALPIVAWKRPRAATVLYWRLTGPGPQDRELWSPDTAMEPT